MTLAITGASGQLGRQAADLLLERHDARDVVLLSRRPAGLANAAARGATVRAADFGVPASLADAFAGVDRLLLISTDQVGARLPQQVAAVRAAVAAGVQRIVYTSLPEPTADNPALVVADHAGTEDALRAGGIPTVVLRNNLYTEHLLPSITEAARSGRYVTNAGSGRAAYVTRADCAAAAVGALISDDIDAGAYDITGPQAWSADELAELAGRTAGHPVEVVDLSDADFTAGLVATGMPQPVAELFASFGASIRGGFLQTVTSAVADLTGRPPTPVTDLLR